MPHYETSRTLTIDPQQAHQILVQGMPSIRDAEIKDPGNPIIFNRKRRITANRYGMNGQAEIDGQELKIKIDGLGSMHQKFAYAIIDLLPPNSFDDHGIPAALAKMDKTAKLASILETRKLIDEMRPGERLRFMTSGFVDKKACAILLTNKRVILKDSGLMEHSAREIDPRSVTSIETGRKMTGENVKLTVSGAEIELDTMPHGRASEFADRLRNLREELSRPVPQQLAPQPEHTPATGLDQIAKLAELHAAGVLTDEEFAAAKAKALGL